MRQDNLCSEMEITSFSVHLSLPSLDLYLKIKWTDTVSCVCPVHRVRLGNLLCVAMKPARPGTGEQLSLLGNKEK